MITRLLRSAVLAVVGMALVGVPALARHDNDRDGDDDERVFVIRDSRPRSGVVVREVRSPRVIVRDRDDDDWRDRFDNDRGRFDDGRTAGAAAARWVGATATCLLARRRSMAAATVATSFCGSARCTVGRSSTSASSASASAVQTEDSDFSLSSFFRGAV